jgi:hypothetical protein
MKAFIYGLMLAMLLGVAAFFFLAAPQPTTAGALASVPSSDQTGGKQVSPAGAATTVPTCTPSWAIVSSPNPGTATTQQFGYAVNELTGVSVVSANDVWAVGFYNDSTATKPATSPSKHVANRSPNSRSQQPSGSQGVLETLIEHWNGIAWSVVDSPNVGSDDNSLAAVVALAADDVWAVGNYINDFGVSQTLVEHWDGATWSVVESPNVGPLLDNELTAIDAVSPTDIWAAGYFFSEEAVGRTLIEHWDGTSWSVVASPNVGDLDNYLYGITVVSATDAWAVGSYAVANPTQLVFKSLALHWNGAIWSVVPTPSVGSFTNILYDVDAAAADDVWAVGVFVSNTRGPRALIEHWDGATWTPVASPSESNGTDTLYSVVAIASDDVWAVGQTGGYGFPPRPLTEHWNGTEWTQVRGPRTDQGGYTSLLSVDALASNDVWAVGYVEGGFTYSRRTLTEHYSTACVNVNCPTSFTDVQPGSPFYPYVQCLACQGIVTGYPCENPADPCFPQPVPTGAATPAATPTTGPNPGTSGFFRPGSPVTRGQLAKIISNSAAFDEDPGQQIFADVPQYSPFYYWINQLAHREILAGYPCGTVPEEPCYNNNMPYFRPNANASRGQIAKIVSNARGYDDAVPPAQQSFADVPPGSPFWLYVERLKLNGSVISGYPCGGVGEPCPGTYFRPQNNASRGQVAKIVSRAFLPNCYLP